MILKMNSYSKKKMRESKATFMSNMSSSRQLQLTFAIGISPQTSRAKFSSIKSPLK